MAPTPKKSPAKKAGTPKSVQKSIKKATPAKKASTPKKSPSPKKSPAKSPKSPKSPKSGKKGGGKPKRGTTAYFYFLNENREKIIAKFKLDRSKVAEVATQGGVEWGKLSDKEKAPYQAKAVKDRARYEKEMLTYVPDSDDEAKSAKKKKKQKKDPNAPKRGMSAYFMWLNENRAKIIKDNKLDSSKVAEVATKAGELWGKMNDKDKAPYVAKAEKDKARYQKEMAKYKPPA